MTTEGHLNPEMLTLARESARLSQTELAALTPYNQSVVSRMEGGQIPLTEENAGCFSQALGLPISFFRQTDRMVGLGASFLFHRKRQRISNIDLRKIQADVNIIRMNIDRLLRGVPFQHDYAILPLDVGVDGTPSEIARMVRASWQLPSGHIRNMVRAVESAGAFVVYYPFHIPRVDGTSLWVSGLPPIIVLNDRMPGDRVRWTLAHELGHLVMHREINQDIEKQADEFASEFLMPAREVRVDLVDLTLPKAAALKLAWKVSIQALVRRARDVETISDPKYKSLYVQLSRSGFRKAEPNEIPREDTANIPRLLDYHFRENGYDMNSLSELVNTTPEQFVRTYCSMSSGPRLRLAPKSDGLR